MERKHWGIVLVLVSLLLLVIAVALPKGEESVPIPTPTRTPKPTFTPLPTDTPTVLPSGQILHVVREGETLQDIARLYGVSLEALVGANELVRAGQVLVIPPTPTSTPQVQATPEEESG